MEITKPEEGFLEGVAPFWEEKLREVVNAGGCRKIKVFVVGLEVVVHGVYVGGEESRGGG